MTGYPSIDKPWKKHHISPPDYIGSLSGVTLYEAYVNANRDNLDSLAIVTMDGDCRYSHRELLGMVDLAAAGFSKMGIGYNSRVGIMLNNTVEEAVSLLALNKLGAISIFIDVTKSVSDIARSIAEYGLCLLLIDEVMLPMEPYVNKDNIPIIIANQTKPSNKGISFLDIYKTGSGIDILPAHYERERPSVIINSSGTTGLPKPIVHTDYSVNMAAYKVLCTDYPLNRDSLIMKIIPSSIGLGLVTTLYTALLSGTPIVLISGDNPQQSIMNTVAFASSFPSFRNKIGLKAKAKLVIFAAPMYYRILFEKLDFFEDLSYIGAMLAAGSKMGKDELDMMNKKMSHLNCPVQICNGYGQNEMCGAVTLNSNSANKNGSAGFPVIDTSVRVVDPETMETLGYNQRGLILEQSDSLFLHYDNLPDETEAAILTLPDGTSWFNTKDLGEMDEDGFLYISGRISRVLVRFDFKIPIDKIEEKIEAHPAVLDCAVIAKQKDDIEEVPVAFISLNDGYHNYSISTILNEIQSGTDPLSDMEYPAQVIQVDSLPYMKNGKVDYRVLEQRA